MQEICQSGSEGGAKHIFVPTPILAQGFNPDHYTQFGETEDTWKASLDSANNTGWKPMLARR